MTWDQFAELETGAWLALALVVCYVLLRVCNWIDPPARNPEEP